MSHITRRNAVGMVVPPNLYPPVDREKKEEYAIKLDENTLLILRISHYFGPLTKDPRMRVPRHSKGWARVVVDDVTTKRYTAMARVHVDDRKIWSPEVGRKLIIDGIIDEMEFAQVVPNYEQLRAEIMHADEAQFKTTSYREINRYRALVNRGRSFCDGYRTACRDKFPNLLDAWQARRKAIRDFFVTAKKMTEVVEVETATDLCHAAQTPTLATKGPICITATEIDEEDMGPLTTLVEALYDRKIARFATIGLLTILENAGISYDDDSASVQRLLDKYPAIFLPDRAAMPPIYTLCDSIAFMSKEEAKTVGRSREKTAT